jgi:hypothetical protein
MRTLHSQMHRFLMRGNSAARRGGKAMKTPTVRVKAVALVFAVSTVATLSAAHADGLGHARAPSPLEGRWSMRITPYACGSDPIVSFPQFAVDSYLTFGVGGALVETTSNPRFAPGQRSPGLGYWERTGRSAYTAVFEAFIQFATTPATSYVRGTQRVEQAIEMVDADHWTSVAVVIFRDEAGNQVPPSGCATATAARMP